MSHPRLIQGGMGAGVSGWRLARAVAATGQLGVVSGTALDAILIRRLQRGDPGGHLHRAMARFPRTDIADRIYTRYHVAGGIADDEPFANVPMYSLRPRPELLELTVLANFVEVTLAREGHEGKVGINYLEKIQLPNLASLYGAMLAGVDYVLMGAGIPTEIPDVLDRYVKHEPASLRIHVAGQARGVETRMEFDPASILAAPVGELPRPHFLPIVSSVTLARALLKRATGAIAGFVIEAPVAGGHNAPPRGALALDDEGQPIYGARDEVDLEQFRRIGLPFWLAGACGSPERIAEAIELGAHGVQIGTLFAFCEESDLTEAIKADVTNRVRTELPRVITDARSSPTGFPFKVLDLPETLARSTTYSSRTRVCDLGYLRAPYVRADGSVDYRCPAEPHEAYERKGGAAEETVGRRCLCNGLVANIGLGQRRGRGAVEPPIVTCGSELAVLNQLLAPGQNSYSAADVVARLCPTPDSQAE